MSPSSGPQPEFRPHPMGMLALFGWLLSATVHVAAYANIALPVTYPALWALHVGIFVVYIPFVISVRRWSSGRRLNWAEMRVWLPDWTPWLVGALFAYSFVNFALSLRGMPAKGTIHLDDPGAHAAAVAMSRAFSGHWMLFYSLPALYFLFVPADARPRNAR